MKQFFTKKTIIGIIIALIVLGGGAFYVFAIASDSASDGTPETSDQQTDSIDNDGSQPLTPNQVLEQENQDPGNSTRPADNEPSKTSTHVLKNPVVYTGYGHNSLKPLPTGQSTSTTCTTDAKVDCTVTFTNTKSGKVITFPTKKTDAEGVALWDWVGGTDVTSGTWKVVAKAGDKSSTKEIIYVQ